MRWPFRRRPEEAAPPATPSPVDRPAGAPTGRRAWQSLPALTPVISAPRITVAAPEVTMTRSLLHRPATPLRHERPAGQVTGLAEVLPALDVTRPVEPQPASRPVPAVIRPLVEGPPLTVATPEYLGEPRAAAEPHRAPAWLRALSSGPVLDPLLGAVMPAVPQRPAPAPQRPVAKPRPAARRPLRPPGRIGLGAPIAPEAEDPEPEPGPRPPATAVAPAPAVTAVPPAGPARVAPPAEPVRPAVTSPVAPDEPAGRRHPGRPVGLGTPITRSPAAPDPTAAPPPGPTVSAAPMALAREIAAAAGVELDRVLVHRGPEIDRRAQDLGAAAYAVDDAVHVGSAAGPDDSAEARALVAHELTHVAQQRRLGSALPEEASVAGGELEAEALAVEQAVRYGAALPDLTHPRRAERSGAGPDPGGVVRAAAGPRRSPARGEGGPGSDPGRPMAAFGQAVGVPENGGAVRGRVQRRATAPIHPHAPASASASPQAAPAATPPTSATSATPAATTAPAAATTAPAAAATVPAAAAVAPAAQPTGWAGFETALGNDARSMVLEAWSLEEPGSSSSSVGGGTQQEQFNQIAGAALNRLNDERGARGEAPLSQLPHDEEMRIMAQIQGGTAATGGLGHGGNQPAPIRNWDDFGSAVTNDLADQYGSFFGIEGSTLTGAAATDTAAATGTTPAAPAAAAGPTASTSATGTPATGTSAAAAHAEEPDEPDLELLTTQLYDRIRSRLRRELLLDRERAGLLSDFR